MKIIILSLFLFVNLYAQIDKENLIPLKTQTGSQSAITKNGTAHKVIALNAGRLMNIMEHELIKAVKNNNISALLRYFNFSNSKINGKAVSINTIVQFIDVLHTAYVMKNKEAFIPIEFKSRNLILENIDKTLPFSIYFKASNNRAFIESITY